MLKESNFYESYFTNNSFIDYRFDVGSYCTRNLILSKVTLVGGKALEIGTGISSLLLDLPDSFEKTGIDISEATIQKTQNLFKELGKKATFIASDAQSLPFADGTFDLVLSSHTFEHIPDDGKAFAEVARVLRPGGECIIFVPGRVDGTATEEEWKNLGHYRSYNRNLIEKLVEKAPTLTLRTLEFPHKIHNMIWGRGKSFLRWVNYPIRKFVLRDAKAFTERKTYQKFVLPVLSKGLDMLDALVKKQEKNFWGHEFNVCARFVKE